jgi:hypothetical protein
MGTPVQIIATPKTAVVEVGGMGRATFKLADANGVAKKAIIDKDIDVSVSGYAVSRTEITDTAIKNFMNIYIKNDSKYQGSDIKVVATSDRYNLVGETTLKVTDGNAFIRIPITEAQTNKTIDMMCTLVTKDGLLAVNTNADRTAAYYGDNAVFEVIGGQTGFVVVSKPEGATVNFDASSSGGSATSLGKQGFEQVRIECDTPGVVTVKMTYGCKAKSGDGEWISYYYEGTQNIMFKDASAEKNVVMHIGSKEVVIDGSPSTIDAAPIVQNNRTYVPFRALAEAFGAEVAYDEATKAVTATLGGKTVVMTMQSDTYTVNGVEQIADVAPFINGSRTMVPVRFVAEAFGSTVTPTYNEHGATTDILFKL